MISSTVERVPANTSDRINRRIQRDMLQRIYYYQQHPDQIETRLAELDQEWDIERTLEANASVLILANLFLSILFGRKHLFFAAGISGFLLQHAVQGWCPPIPVFRRLGLRTATEIEIERYALKILRGDMDTVQGSSEMEATVAILQRPNKIRPDLH
jgi:hypothetical protein